MSSNNSQSTTVRRSLSHSLTASLGSVAVAANTVTGAIQSVGNLVEELNLRSEARLSNVKADLAMNNSTRLDELAADAVDRATEVAKRIGTDEQRLQLFAKYRAIAEQAASA